jgi:hypothetical protein
MKWLKSSGGPLICMEDALTKSWGGDRRVTGGPTDYERACRVQEYLGVIKVADGSAIVLGDMPLESAILDTSPGGLALVRAFYLDPGANVSKMLQAVDEAHFDDPLESVGFQTKGGSLVLFDSALPGHQRDKVTLEFTLLPGTHRVLTKKIDPDDRTSLLVHKFYLEN